MIFNQERNEGALRKLVNQYDPNNNLGSPAVTHADMALTIIIRDLIEVIGGLQTRDEDLIEVIEGLQTRVKELEDNVRELENYTLGKDGYQ